MKLKLHEIELHTKDPEGSKRFYHEILGLGVNVDEKGLKVFDTGYGGIDFDTSVHFPGEVSISFLVADVDEFVEKLRAKGIEVKEPGAAHLGMRAICLHDPDGYRIAIQCPTEASPDWLKDLTR